MDSHYIRVDTEKLREFSEGYYHRADSFNEAGKSVQYAIQLIINHCPDYDGRLQQAGRSDSLDLFNRCQYFFKWFRDDSDSLLKTAEAFEEVDGQTVKIFEEAQGITSRASFVDQYGGDGLGITTTQTVVNNPDGSVSTITIVKTVNPDGSITTVTTIKTVKVLDAETASQWNKDTQKAEIILGIAVFGIIGVEATALCTAIGLSDVIATAAGVVVPGGIEAAIEIPKVDNPDRGWQPGDTITNTVIMVTTEQPDLNLPIDQPPAAPDITNTTVVTDSSGNILTEDTTGIDSYGNLKP
jgi:hypothetical protein